MRLTVLGGAGAWPPAGGACSGYLVDHGGFRLLVDPGYATLPRLLEIVPDADIDAVLVSHRHPDHVADLNPLLRARVMGGGSLPALPTYALPDALTAVLALDRMEAVTAACDIREFDAGEAFSIGPFAIQSRRLPHPAPNSGFRITVDGRTLTYTGDAAPSDDLVELADSTDLLLAEATYVDVVPADTTGSLNSAAEVGRQAERASVGRLLLTHLMPGTDPGASISAAARAYDGPIDVATSGVVVELT
jgi:ribonuclease BN (tRNA processing enzyme)